MKLFKLFNFPDSSDILDVQRNIRRLQDDVAQSVNPVLANPLLDGRILKVDLVSATTNRVGHGLSRMPLGWFPLTRTGPVHIYEPTVNRQLRSTQLLYLDCSADVTVELWVF